MILETNIRIQLIGHVYVCHDQELSNKNSLNYKKYFFSNIINLIRIYFEGPFNKIKFVEGKLKENKVINQRVEIVFL